MIFKVILCLFWKKKNHQNIDKIDSLVYDNGTEHVNCAHFWYFMVLGI